MVCYGVRPATWFPELSLNFLILTILIFCFNKKLKLFVLFGIVKNMDFSAHTLMEYIYITPYIIYTVSNVIYYLTNQVIIRVPRLINTESLVEFITCELTKISGCEGKVSFGVNTAFIWL